MPWTSKRVFTLIGVAASSIAVLTFLNQAYPEWNLGGRISGVVDRVGRLWLLLPEVYVGPVGLGHIVLAIVGIFLFLFLFYRPRTKGEKRGDIFQWKQRTFRREVRESLGELRELTGTVLERLGQQPADVLRAEAMPPKPLAFSAAQFVNAPISRVWLALTETNCGPTCRELLSEVNVTKREEGVINWQGKGRILDRDIFAEGSTTLSAPSRLDIICHSGALKGFKGAFTLREAGKKTEVKEDAEFDLNSVPSEFSPMVPGLSALVGYVISRDLARIRERVESS